MKKWAGQKCQIHGCYRDEEGCTCSKPFQLFPFPNKSTNLEARLHWAKLVNRKDPKTGQNWQPKADDRVCSEHFLGGRATEKHPHPVLNLPVGVKQKVSRPPPTNREKSPVARKKRKRKVDVSDVAEVNVNNNDHDYTHTCTCPSTSDCSCEFQLCLKKSICNLIHELEEVKEKSTNQTAVTSKHVDKTLRFLRTNKKTRLYTGLPNKAAFSDLYRHVSHKASIMRYWQGDRKEKPAATRSYKKTPVKTGAKRKLTLKEELLIVLMKLRLGFLNEVLGDIFGVSSSSVSIIFNTWIKLLSQELRPLVFYPDKFITREKLPKQLSHYTHLRCTLDCTEVYIERPRHQELQALTWSDYKRHNTIKFLVGIAPNGHISFLSDTWGGRASDQHIVRQSGFLELVEPGDVIMADRGFTIREDLLLRGATLEIPPPSSGIEQMSRRNVLKTKAIANARIHVERAIGRMKTFSIIKNVFPITLVPLADDIILVCAALCNLLPPLVF